MKYFVKKFIIPCLYYLFRLFPVKSNKIFISNYYGKGYGDIPKYIVNELLNEGYTYDIVWAVNGHSFSMDFPKKVRIVKRNTIKYIYEQVTSKIWIDNCRKQFYERKRKNQIYIQTWHGGFPSKKVEQEVEDKLNAEYVLGAKNDSKMMDLLISNNKYMTNMFKKCFWYDGQILECGNPRNDIIFNHDSNIREKVFSYYRINKENHICLYAPTFRKDESLEPYNIDFMRLKKSLEKKYGGKWKILVRLHPNIAYRSNEFIKYNNDIIDASNYVDMQELLVATDFMITDYSSCILDYSISYKDGCIYASDISDYMDDRGMHFKITEYPFDIATNNDELTKIIEDFDEKKHKKRIKAFFDKIGCVEDGKGTKTVVEYIKDKCK